MNIYSPKQDDELFSAIKEWYKKNPLTLEDFGDRTSPPPTFIPILFGQDNGFYGKKHTPEQIKSWSEMRLGDKNPNWKGKSFTEETYKKLRQPKLCKDNYKGSPGKICAINKNGEAIQITTEIYNKQKDSGLPMEQWEFVSTVSKVAKIRRIGDNFKYT
jgi:hypothetical protein